MPRQLRIGNYQWLPQSKINTAVETKLWLKETDLYEVDVQDFPILPGKK